MEYPVPISVVMATYNTPTPFLKTAVESVLNQTFTAFEFIIVDDASTNESVDYLKGLTDERVRIVRNSSNLGITKSLNIGLREARGKYIARMDADDISLPQRFEKQYLFMEANPDAIICGSEIVDFCDESEIVPILDAGKSRALKGKISKVKKIKAKAIKTLMEDYRIRMLFIYPRPFHPTIFINHEKLDKHNLRYDEELYYAQDYGLYADACRFGLIYELKEVLVCKRYGPSQISSKNRDAQSSFDKATQKKLLLNLLGEITQEELDFHYSMSYSERTLSFKVIAWLNRLINANKKRRVYNQIRFRKYAFRVMLKCNRRLSRSIRRRLFGSKR
jgi:glycosyltransferase involved in cell wall biosynthesis